MASSKTPKWLPDWKEVFIETSDDALSFSAYQGVLMSMGTSSVLFLI